MLKLDFSVQATQNLRNDILSVMIGSHMTDKIEQRAIPRKLFSRLNLSVLAMHEEVIM